MKPKVLCEPGKYLAFLIRVDIPPERRGARGDRVPKRRRLEYLFDAVLLGAAARGKGAVVEPLERPILRVKTTQGKVQTPRGRPYPGDWFLIELKPRTGGGAWTWAGIENDEDPTGYSGAGNFSASSIEYLDPTLQTGPAADSEIKEPFAAFLAVSRTRARQPSTGPNDFVDLTAAMGDGKRLYVEAVDVGQASFACVRDQDWTYLFFDVGLPLWFNHRSMPSKVNFRPPHEHAVVVLSHWDFDHYSALRKHAALRERRCIAPSEGRGPNAEAMAQQLGTNLEELDWRIPLNIPYARLRWAEGTDKNGRGIIGIVRLPDQKVLLTGDAEYSKIPQNYKKGLTGVSIPHHASLYSTGSPPVPNVPRRAVVSAGRPNTYGHPGGRILTRHRNAGWTVAVTGDNGNNARGNKRL